MVNRELILQLRQAKQDKGLTLHELSKKLDVSVSTIERWFKSNRINKVYANLVKEKLELT